LIVLGRVVSALAESKKLKLAHGHVFLYVVSTISVRQVTFFMGRGNPFPPWESFFKPIGLKGNIDFTIDFPHCIFLLSMSSTSNETPIDPPPPSESKSHL